MSLRKNILLINLKIHSAYNKFFSEKIYTFDAYSALDIIGYLRGVHHKFSKHMVDIASGKSDDCFNLLDGNLQEITDEMLYIKKFKEGETVHLVPTVCGGGGKAGRKMFMIFAIAVVVMNPALLGAAGGGGGGLAGLFGGAGAPLNAIPALGPVTTGAGTGLSFTQTMGLNLAMAAVTSLMTKSPAKRASKQTESTVRENGMFGGLTNRSTSGTPIALIYGQTRVGGQFLSGYISSIDHGSGDPISVGGQFDGV